MNSKERVMCALSGEQPDRVPFCESGIATNIGRALAGTKENLPEHELSALLGRDVVSVIVYPPYFAKQKQLDPDDDHMYVEHGLLTSRKALDIMEFPDPNDPELYKEAREVLENKGSFATVACIKNGVAPTLVSMGLEAFSYAMADDPDLIHEILKRYVDWQLIVTENLIRMGFDFLWCFDDIAYGSGPFLSPRAFRKFLLPAFQRAVEAITIPWIFHSDGNLMPILDDILALGPSGLHPLEPGAMDLALLKEKYGKKICLIGNVSVDRLSAGTPEQIEEIVKYCLKTGSPGGGYMISSSNSIPRYANPENVKVMADCIRKYAEYPVNI